MMLSDRAAYLHRTWLPLHYAIGWASPYLGAYTSALTNAAARACGSNHQTPRPLAKFRPLDRWPIASA
jgi:hypothetical protein